MKHDNQQRTPSSNHKQSRRLGYTVLETVLAVFIMTIVFIGTMALFTSATAMGAKASTASSTSQDAANLMQRLSDEFKEGYLFALPASDSTGTNWPSTLTKTSYSYTDSGGTTHYTGVYVEYPPTADAFQVYVTSNAPSPVASPSPYDRSKAYSTGTTPTAYVYYRADSQGNPSSYGSGATYLYKEDASGNNRVQIASDIASEPGTSSPLNPAAEFASVNGMVQIKVVCGGYSHLVGEQTSDQTNGQVIAAGFGARLVAMRNAQPANQQSGDKTDHVTVATPSGFVASGTPTPSNGPTATATLPPTPTPTPTASPSPTPTPYHTATPSPTPTPYHTPTPTPTPTPYHTPTPTPSPSPTPTPYHTPTPTPTPTLGLG